MHLYISNSKTFLTVFHHEEDISVRYSGDKVFVDGHMVDIKVYGRQITASNTFKYLGVVLKSTGSHSAHFADRQGAVSNAAASLQTGLKRMPSYGHAFVEYLWSSLVLPVVLYGFELFVVPQADLSELCKFELQWWRRLLHAGGRCPLDAVRCLTETRVDIEM